MVGVRLSKAVWPACIGTSSDRDFGRLAAGEEAKAAALPFHRQMGGGNSTVDIRRVPLAGALSGICTWDSPLIRLANCCEGVILTPCLIGETVFCKKDGRNMSRRVTGSTSRQRIRRAAREANPMGGSRNTAVTDDSRFTAIIQRLAPAATGLTAFPSIQTAGGADGAFRKTALVAARQPGIGCNLKYAKSSLAKPSAT